MKTLLLFVQDIYRSRHILYLEIICIIVNYVFINC
jgi:hypothetical protein